VNRIHTLQFLFDTAVTVVIQINNLRHAEHYDMQEIFNGLFAKASIGAAYKPMQSAHLQVVVEFDIEVIAS